jgi:hypothetical protein
LPEYPTIVTVEVTDRWITAGFSDGRQISLALAWSWRLERGAVSGLGLIPRRRRTHGVVKIFPNS